MNSASRPLTPADSRPRVLVIDDDVALYTALTVALEDDFSVEVATPRARRGLPAPPTWPKRVAR
jgi:hypothetical protein